MMYARLGGGGGGDVGLLIYLAWLGMRPDSMSLRDDSFTLLAW